jgi:hypothetical protein
MCNCTSEVRCFASPRNDGGKTHEIDLAARSARVLPETVRLREQRARGRPGARRTRGLASDSCNKIVHTSIQVWRRHPAFPAQWLYGLLRARPGDRLSCHRHLWKLSLPRNLTPAPGRQAHTTSPYASVTLVFVTSASTASHRTFVTIASRPSHRVRPAELDF